MNLKHKHSSRLLAGLLLWGAIPAAGWATPPAPEREEGTAGPGTAGPTSGAASVPAVAAPGAAGPTSGGASVPAVAAPGTTAPPGTLTYVSKTTAYLDHGRDRGLERGATLQVMRDGKSIGRLEILQVSDHRASAKVLAADRPLREGDQLALPPPPAPEPTAARKTEYLELPEGELVQAWSAALAQERPVAVEFKSDRAAAGFTARAGAETALVSAADFPTLSVARAEQNLALWAQGSDGGARGLDVRIRADFALRYDTATDQFLPGQRIYPLVYEVAVRYAPARSPWTATVGRLRPAVRRADMVDGVQVGWKSRHFGLVGFAGLKPSMTSLAPRTDRQAFGAALNYRPALTGLKWSGQVSYGLDLAGGGLARQTLAMDNHLTWNRLSAHQSLTVDYLATGAAAGGQGGIDLSELFAGATYRLGERLELGLNARMNGRALLAADADELPAGWADALTGRNLIHVDAGARLVRSDRAWLRPYLFWNEDTHQGDVTTNVLGGGLSWHLSGLWGGPLGLDLSGDYGDGTRQQASLLANLQGPIARDRLRLSGGLLNFWSFGHDTGIHTFQHLLNARLEGAVLERVNLWATLMGGVDFNIATGPLSPGGVMMGELGAAARW